MNEKEFYAVCQLGSPVRVINIGNKMTICATDDPIYITKEQAMKFFDLQQKPLINKDNKQ
jgi:hypothetical protein